MGCCGKRINYNIPRDQQKIIDKIDSTNLRNSSATKSNRSPAGTVARECPNCKTKTILRICPVCSFKLN